MLDAPATRPRLSFCWLGLGSFGCVLAPTELVDRCARPFAYRVRSSASFDLDDLWSVDPGDLLVVDAAVTRPRAGQIVITGSDRDLTIREYHPRTDRVTVRGLVVGVVCGRTGKVWTQAEPKLAA